MATPTPVSPAVITTTMAEVLPTISPAAAAAIIIPPPPPPINAPAITVPVVVIEAPPPPPPPVAPVAAPPTASPMVPPVAPPVAPPKPTVYRSIFQCRICGEIYLSDGTVPPERCPFCGSLGKLYMTMDLSAFNREQSALPATNSHREKELLAASIQGEKYDSVFYSIVARFSKDKQLPKHTAKIFDRLSKIEGEHFEIFERLLDKNITHRVQRALLNTPRVVRDDLCNMATMTDVLEAAIKRELEAAKNYAEYSVAPDVNEYMHMVWKALSDVENDHALKLEDIAVVYKQQQHSAEKQ